METQRPALLRLSTVRPMKSRKSERKGWVQGLQGCLSPSHRPSLGVRETSPSREPPRLLQKGSILLVRWIYFGRHAEVARCTFEGKLSEPHHHRAMLCKQQEGNTRACSHAQTTLQALTVCSWTSVYELHNKHISFVRLKQSVEARG